MTFDVVTRGPDGESTGTVEAENAIEAVDTMLSVLPDDVRLMRVTRRG